MKKIIIIGFILLVVVSGFLLFFRPVPIVTEDEAMLVSGIVSDIYEGTAKDVVFRLSGDDIIYYVNRGVEHGLEIETLKKELIGNQVTFKYPDHRTPLNRNNKTRHISKVEFDNKVLYNELLK